MKCPLGIYNFLEEISRLSHSIAFLCFFALIAEEGFLISPCYSLDLCIQMGLSFLFFWKALALLEEACCSNSVPSCLSGGAGPQQAQCLHYLCSLFLINFLLSAVLCVWKSLSQSTFRLPRKTGILFKQHSRTRSFSLASHQPPNRPAITNLSNVWTAVQASHHSHTARRRLIPSQESEFSRSLTSESSKKLYSQFVNYAPASREHQ